MQVLCVATNDEQADAVCPTCGQKYAVYYSRPFSPECQAALEAVRTTLVRQHAAAVTGAAHPSPAFNVPEWKGEAHMSGAALLSNAPLRQLMKSDAEDRLAS